MTEPEISPVGTAFTWVGRITAIGLIMVLPGVGGAWLDRQLETTLLEPVGFLFGFTLGLACIVRLTAANPQKKQ